MKSELCCPLTKRSRGIILAGFLQVRNKVVQAYQEIMRMQM